MTTLAAPAAPVPATADTSVPPRPALAELSYRMLLYRRTWRRTLIMSFVNPLLFFAGIGIGLGRLVDHSGGDPLPGVSYLAYLAPGLLAATAMQTGALESGFTAYQSLRMRPTYRAPAASPLSPADVLDGHLLFNGFRILTSCLAFFAVTAAAGLARSPWALLAPFAALLTGLAFAAPFFAGGVLATRQGTVQGMFRFIIMPLYLFSGTYAPVSRFPEPVRILAYALPLWHGVQLCRGLTFGTLSAPAAAEHVGYLLAVTAAGYAFARHAYAARLHD
ncbi:ABC transporter permease [Actinospica durhamensis]|uniref:Transport permease protein n=1 Tax=Actinospica durhamensis TaxID=1508375 RepID=A0A941EVT0_9ACTN|nr:ABC transporter permease [Actinospica durhamensis]MBR7837348.1 ABC transporter permease [Actinospica durhamensis]